MTEHVQTFRRWTRDYWGLVAKVARAHAWLPEDREDLTQEILVQLWRSVTAFRGDARESTWIYRVALNTAMTWRRKTKRHAVDGRSNEEVPCLRPMPDAAATNKELIAWLYSQIAACSKVDRSLLLLYLEGVSYREMAEILGISESNVGVKLNRLKRRLAENMKGTGHELG